MRTTTAAKPALDLDQVNQQLADADAPQVIRWAYETFGDRLIMTSSFGAKALIMLHLATRVVPDIPVVFIDTGYHFPETYRFVDEWAGKLKLNLKVYAPPTSAGWFEATHGKLWEGDGEQLEQYNRLRKVEPMQRAIRELKVAAWLAGLRAQETAHRQTLRTVTVQDGIYKVHPILHWSQRDVHEYLKQHDLAYHPLYDKGYRSIGDWHSTLPVTAGENERAGRFRGLRQECGLHLPKSKEEDASRESSGL